MRLAHLLEEELLNSHYKWLVTGGAGFIGSNIVEVLLSYGQSVCVIDNLSTGFISNLEEAERGPLFSNNRGVLKFIEGDTSNRSLVEKQMRGVDFVLHQAALGSVPRSVGDPLSSNVSNVDGFLSVLHYAKEAKVKGLVYASSSSVYGDDIGLPKVESRVGSPLSPYALTKKINEQYASVFESVYGFGSIGLRYFNVFGPRQNPSGEYAAVIPLWFGSMLTEELCFINGDGSTSRDFNFVDNVVQANLLAALYGSKKGGHHIYNVSFGKTTSLNDLHILLKENLVARVQDIEIKPPRYRDFRTGDISHSLGDITKAEVELGYAPRFDIDEGLGITADWYVNRFSK